MKDDKNKKESSAKQVIKAGISLTMIVLMMIPLLLFLSIFFLV